MHCFFQTGDSASWYPYNENLMPIVCSSSARCCGQWKRKLCFTSKVSLLLWCDGFYHKILKWMQWEILGCFFLKVSYGFCGGWGQERWCWEMKADSFRYTDEYEMKKEKFLKQHSKSQEDMVEKFLRLCSSCQAAAEGCLSFAVAFLFKFDSYHRQGVTTFSHQKLSGCV